MTGTQAAAAQLQGVTVAYGGVPALRQVSVRFAAGRVHALLGENGAGKSTLLTVLLGRRPAAGTVHVLGGSRVETAQLGWMHQHGTLLAELSVLDNFALTVPGLGLLGRRRLRGEVAAQLRKVGIELSPERQVAELAHSQRQLVEFARLQWQRRALLLLDEPTAQMDKRAAQRLMAMLRAAADRGQTVIITGHRLGEVWQWADELHVLRRGRLALSAARSELTKQQLLAAMFGEAAQTSRRPAAARPPAGRRWALEIAGLKVAAGIAFDLQVAAGEIVGLVGPSAEGIGQLMAVLCGLEEAAQGSIRIDGELRGGRSHSAWGMRRIPAAIMDDACVAQMSVAENLLMHRRRCGGWLIDWSQARREAARLIEREQLAVPDPDCLLAWLSGGNQRKLVIARELAQRGSVVVAHNMEAGLDLQAVAQLADKLAALRDAGAAVLLLADDYAFVGLVANRVLTVAGGQAAQLDAAQSDLSAV